MISAIPGSVSLMPVPEGKYVAVSAYQHEGEIIIDRLEVVGLVAIADPVECDGTRGLSTPNCMIKAIVMDWVDGNMEFGTLEELWLDSSNSSVALCLSTQADLGEKRARYRLEQKLAGKEFEGFPEELISR